MTTQISKEKKDTLKLTGLLTFSTLLGKALSIPSGIIVAKVLGPAILGSLAIINLIRQYAGYSHLGLLQCLPRDVPIAYGKGDKKLAQELRNTIFTGYFAAISVGLMVIWILYFAGMTFKETLTFQVLLLITAILIAGRIHAFLKAHVKAEGKFFLIGKEDLIAKILTPALVIPFVYFFKLTGILTATLIIEIVAVGYLFIVLNKHKFQLRIDLEQTFQLLKNGFMIFINKLSDSIFMSIGLIIISSELTLKEVGLYSIALSVTMAKNLPFAQAINMTIYRKMMVEGGRYGTKNIEHFRKYTEKSFVLYFIFNSLVLGGMILLYKLIIDTILIEYTKCIPVMLILYLGYLVYTCRVFLSFYLNVTNQLHKRLGMIIVGLLLNSVLCFALIRLGYGINGAAISCSISFIIVTSLIAVTSLQQLYKNSRYTALFLLRILLVAIILTALLTGLTYWTVFDLGYEQNIYIKAYRGISEFAVKGVIFSVICLTLFFFLYRKFHVYAELRSLLNHAGNSVKANLGKIKAFRFEN